ncbi:MAG: DotU family type IV/VI secretion system protein [Planctomycetes bacterium]|nr:DotU family type IV/VI secretion system protein [Planctomycetota bacterium]
MNSVDKITAFIVTCSDAFNSAKSTGANDPTQLVRMRERIALLAREVQATRTARNSRYFDQTWFAVCAWFDEKIVTLPSVDGELLYPSFLRNHDDMDGGMDFYQCLEDLLADTERHHPNDDAKDTIAVFAMCLRLGYHGRCGRAHDQGMREEYLHRCVRYLEEPIQAKTRLRRRRRGRRTGMILSHALLWLLPVTVTFGLFAIFREMLHYLVIGTFN